MTTLQLVEKVKRIGTQKIGRAPVVVLPLKIWEEIADRLEESDISQSRSLAGRISKARREKKLYSSGQVRKLVGV